MTDIIFRPNFNITDDSKRLLEEVDREQWLIRNILLMPKHQAWIRRDVSIRRAAGTTRIEGATLDEDAVSELLRKNPTGKFSEDEQANINALQAYEFIDYVSDQTDIPIDELVIRQINREFLRGAAVTLTPGAYRKGQNTAGDYNPPEQGNVAPLMRSFALWLRQESGLDPIVKAGIAHIHLVAIHPFWDGNGRTARGVATLILQRSQFDFRKLLSLESFMFDTRDRYFGAIERTLGTQFDPDYDATPWLEFFLSTLLAHALQLVSTLTEWHRRMGEVYEQFERSDLINRQADGYIYALQVGKISRADYMEITGVSGVTASRDLAKLVGESLLIPKGKTRNRVYIPIEDEPDLDSPASPGQLPLPEQ